ncbi:MAG: sialidase family protein [Anaerolineae bacterium]|nr:sialidase family protein [Anaerolineae bacterium]
MAIHIGIRRGWPPAIAVVCLSVVIFLQVVPVSAAGGDVIACTPDYNISQSPDLTSGDPFLVADPAGLVHLFWAERVTVDANALSNVPDAVMYSVWNGRSWSHPVDIFLSPPEFFNRRVNGIRAVIDEERILHLLWQGPDNTLYYSSAPADEGRSARAWQEPLLLASDEAGSQFSAYLAYEPPATLHVVYGQGISNAEHRGVVYVRSTDAGRNWSEPAELTRMVTTGRGPSNVRLLVAAPDILYATWTEWDLTGNGQAIYFARSPDGGLTWSEPVTLDERQGDEYERDWTTLALLGDEQVVAFWEGGYRAYRQAQYSYDGGETWSEPVDTLDWLIADNGFAEFARDSAGRLHLFVLQRVREGNDDKGRREGLWHTVWEGGQQWREPQLIGNQTPANLVSVAISGGNQLFAATFGTFDYEIYVRRCTIEGAPVVEPESGLTTSLTQEANSVTGEETVSLEVTAEAPASLPGSGEVPAAEVSPRDPLLLGFTGPLLLIVVTITAYMLRRRA